MEMEIDHLHSDEAHGVPVEAGWADVQIGIEGSRLVLIRMMRGIESQALNLQVGRLEMRNKLNVHCVRSAANLHTGHSFYLNGARLHWAVLLPE